MRPLFVHRPFIDRFVPTVFRERLSQHARRWGITYPVFLIVAALFQANFGFGLNASPSLPDRLFLIHKGELPQRGQYVAFRWPGGGPYPAGVTFVKIVAGMTGDSVTRMDRDYYVNGIAVGTVKTVSRKGLPLEP
ncbi:MAG TPA: S26 family signal peptidase, partial [Steroidobacteraceae bacterium]|nr:S26 family signal peptidase [Steroidobacteraceae bacterium]